MKAIFYLERTNQNMTGEMTDSMIWEDAQMIPRIGDKIKVSKALIAPIFEIYNVLWTSKDSVVLKGKQINKI